MATHDPTQPLLLAIRDPDVRPHASADWRARLELLRAWMADRGQVIVAYSGGVDSSLLLRVAHDVLGERALGVIGVSDSYATHELQSALDQAARFGARVRTVITGELSDPVFASNPTDRCYHCKSELYAQLAAVAGELRARGPVTVIDGTIADDLSDWRPGRRAAEERDVQSPLAELGFRKADVRGAAESLGLTSAAKPASPCLASRIPYGTPITRQSLNQIEQAEALLRDLGFSELRVRHHGETARIEVPLGDLPRLAEPPVREAAVKGLQALGFRWVTVDLAGLRSGNLNPPGLMAGREPAESKETPLLGEITDLSGTSPASVGNKLCALTEAGESSDRFRDGSKTGVGK